MKLDYQAAKSDTGEHIKSSRIFHDLLELMRQVELFKTQDNIRGHDLEDVIQVMSIEKFEKNDVVFEYGKSINKITIKLVFNSYIYCRRHWRQILHNLKW